MVSSSVSTRRRSAASFDHRTHQRTRTHPQPSVSVDRGSPAWKTMFKHLSPDDPQRRRRAAKLQRERDLRARDAAFARNAELRAFDTDTQSAAAVAVFDDQTTSQRDALLSSCFQALENLRRSCDVSDANELTASMVKLFEQRAFDLLVMEAADEAHAELDVQREEYRVLLEFLGYSADEHDEDLAASQDLRDFVALVEQRQRESANVL